MRPACLAVVGATCTGKSSLAMGLARRLNGEVVNGDALQVYRGLDKGTAKPSLAERRRVRHHLVDILDPRERFSAGEFARRARLAIDDIRSRGRVAIVVGGSGFYLRALLEGLAPIPPVSPAVRRELEERLDAEGLESLWGELSTLDPVATRRLARTDSQRILRALEVARGTGRTLSEWQADEPAEEPLPALRIGLTLPRTVLYDRIASRAYRMLGLGWLEEVRRLLREGVPESAPAFQAIGYRELLSHLRGLCSLEEAMARTIRATRRYAKRQETWFRRDKVAAWFRPSDSGTTVVDVLDFVTREGFLGRP